jgi:putative transposase
MERANRSHPAHGILTPNNEIPIVFLTVCTKDRQPWLACDRVHETLVQTWQRATSWLVGRYVVMPDHIHAFVSPNVNALPLENWVTYWKSQFSKTHKLPQHRWQTDHWDTRLRSWQKYDEKWEYVRLNPVRHGLVQNAHEWPYQGVINDLRWD